MSMTEQHALEYVRDVESRADKLEAIICALARDRIKRGWFRAITDRSEKELYLLRMWISEPTPVNGEEAWESGNSTLLHFFPRPDLDPSLHDHPWDFATTIIHGGYVEHLPPKGWVAHSGAGGVPLGPQWDQNKAERRPNQRVIRKAEDLHCVGSLLGSHAWTLVSTGPRRRQWGFHPPGQRWMTYPEYRRFRAGK